MTKQRERNDKNGNKTLTNGNRDKGESKRTNMGEWCKSGNMRKGEKRKGL